MSQGSQTPAAAQRHARPDRIVLRSYPKIILLYPAWLMAIGGGILSIWSDNHPTFTLWFILVLSLNLVVISFEFPRTTSFTLFFLVIAVIFGALWVNQKWVFLPRLAELWGLLQPSANGQFYWLFAFALGVIYIFVFIDTRLDYWEIMPNEIIHHLGVLGNVNRYPAPNLKMEKEITDVFEFMLLRCGRLLLHPSTERRAIVLDNVLNINKREKEIQTLLGVLDVHVHSSDDLPAPEA
jgi:hypothetical protein